MLQNARSNYSHWYNNISEVEILEQPVRFHLTFSKDTMTNLVKIKTALKTDIITNGDQLAKIIFGNSAHSLLSMSNATNCRKLLVSNNFETDLPNNDINS